MLEITLKRVDAATKRIWMPEKLSEGGRVRRDREVFLAGIQAVATLIGPMLADDGWATTTRLEKAIRAAVKRLKKEADFR